ncbi:MAG: hypothetical protein U0X74_00470 [Anaerolineales bacterium]
MVQVEVISFVRITQAAQQSVHPTLGILARFQAFFYALSFFQADGVPPPAPARVTQTVGWLAHKTADRFMAVLIAMKLRKKS